MTEVVADQHPALGALPAQELPPGACGAVGRRELLQPAVRLPPLAALRPARAEQVCRVQLAERAAPAERRPKLAFAYARPRHDTGAR